MKIGLLFALFSFTTVASDVLAFNEKVIREKFKRDLKEDSKLEYYTSRQFDHPDADPEMLTKNGASLEDAKMQADGLTESKVVKKAKQDMKSENVEAKLQEMTQGEEKHVPKRRHHRHELKINEKANSSMVEKVTNKEGKKEKKILHSNKSHKTIESTNSEELKIAGKGDSKPVSTSKHGKRTHDKKKKGHKHATSGHKMRKHGGSGGKKLRKPSKDKKDRKSRKSSHH